MKRKVKISPAPFTRTRVAPTSDASSDSASTESGFNARARRYARSAASRFPVRRSALPRFKCARK